MNAQLAPIEAGLTRADIPYQVRGVRFFDRPEVRGAIDLVRRGTAAGKLAATGPNLAKEIRAMWAARLGYEGDDEEAGGGAEPGGRTAGDGRTMAEGRTAGEEARERTAALDTLIDILSGMLASDGGLTAAAYVAELDRRRAAERAGSADGVNLLTYHRAKGLEWDAVALPMLEEGSLPIRQALDDDALLEEERRLFYVGLTRARDHLAISWAAEREVRGRSSRRSPSQFLADLRPRPATRVVQLPDRFEEEQARRRSIRSVASAGADPADDDPLMAALRAWRTSRAREDHVPPYIVFHDQTLAAIAEIRPASLAGLRRVKGIGAAKLDAYGDEILEVVRTHAGG
jgi:DNA helicase-2/ATP-dependent DNA helicase PcrA